MTDITAPLAGAAAQPSRPKLEHPPSAGTATIFFGLIAIALLFVGYSLYDDVDATGVKTTTYQVSALKPGTYYFQCDIHPTAMFGTFIVK